MDAIQRLQPLDYILAVIWAAIVGWGAQSGLIRQVVMLVATYLGALIASQLYQPAGIGLTLFGPGPGAIQPSQFIAFIIIFFVVLVSVALLVRRLYPGTELASNPRLDRILGALVGAVWGFLLLIQLMTIARFFTVTFWPGQEFTQLSVTSQLQRSQIVPVLQVGLAPLYALMSPWFPERITRPGVQ